MPQPPPPGSAPPGSPDRPRPQPVRWRRLPRTPRGAAGLGIVAAALLLWPFSDWSPWPWLAGIGTLALLRLLRLDGLLRGWAPHLAGLVVVGWLVSITGFWAWAVAASIGLLIVGLAQLPEWRIAAVGAVLCLVTGIGYAIGSYESAAARDEVAQQLNQRDATRTGAQRPQGVLPELLTDISQGDVRGACDKLDPAAEAQFVAAAAAADCAGAVAVFDTAIGDAPQSREMRADVMESAGGTDVDACSTIWPRPGLGGPELGVLELRQAPPPGGTWFVAAFRPC